MSLLQKLNFSWFNRLPVIRQTQAAECGLTCVGMIANYYGHDIDMISLRRRFSTSLKGSTLSDVISVAQRLGLTSRALRIELEELPQLKTPCILHWKLDHFVVLKKVDGKKIVIHDPATGVRVVPMKEVSDHFTGVALELVPSTDFQPKKEKETLSMRKLIGSVSGVKSAFLQIMILCVALELFGILGPFFMQWVMDMVLVSADYSLLSLLGMGFIMVAIFQNLISALRSWVMTWFSSMLSVQWTTNVCRHMLKLPLIWFESRHVGDVLSRYDSLNTIQNTLTTRFISTLLDGVMSIVTLVMLFVYNGTLAWLVIALFVSYAIIRLVSYEPLRRATEDQIVSGARTQSSLLETLRGIQAVKTNNKQTPRLSVYMNYLIDTTNKNIVIQKLSILFGTTQGLISSIGRVVLIWLAARQVLEGNFSAGMLTAFISFSDQFIGRAAGLINALIDFRMLRMHGERLSDIVLAEIEPEQDHTEPAQAQGADRVGDITLRALKFRYAETEPWVINGINLTIKAGESVAIVGPSGQGKTTLAKIILGLLHPDEGSILVDGHEIARTGLQHHREQIGCVMQDDILFSGSIAENISFFDAEMDMEKVIRVARAAQIHDDIMSIPMNYYSLVGDMGSFLSGGQQQRVLLARALYREPKILVLDEATSHLDVKNEHLINTEIKKMQVTRIIVAHRPETIRSADRIILLQNGRASELTYSQLFPQRIKA
ncbi:colicin V processing peptidase [Enterobacter sp. BIGb0383]|uniref:peptidase domain-containing ABC transporter n=1 Tax=unclassified Enterobacter TaxID=2608935 RepID=UPI000FB79C73|nr:MULTISPECIES: peptidase domain-containing ABC transporter [unclassified Enterobacter]ROP59605.1 colicin V processing peptidase [Enterobacter sp. BIGb0383]ROS08927.1 colicin V processing peptidase [Enterobacter sp. BIGb0359]